MRESFRRACTNLRIPRDTMKVLIVSPEVAPFARAGGLADFAGSLAVSLGRLGHDVRVMTPKYKMTDEAAFGLTPCIEQLDAPISTRKEPCSILKGALGAVPVYFLKHDAYYRRDYLYGDSQGDYPDNAERFIYFSRSILEACKALQFFPDVIHCCDWQSGLVPVYLRETYRADPTFAKTAALFTVYNLTHQGLFWHYDMHLTGLGWDLFTPDGLEYYGKINLMKAGVIWADIVSTVSVKYSQEIQTKEFGQGLEGVFQYRSRDLYGVVNGVNYAAWDPATDEKIAKPYAPISMSGKAICKTDLLNAFRLSPPDDAPVISMIAPLREEKGADLLAEIAEKIIGQPACLIVMGTGAEKYHKLFHLMREKYAPKFGLLLDDDDAMAHKILAGSDMLLLPFRCEPFGTHQMRGLRYGTIPIVRATGSLCDTVRPFDAAANTGTGFTFETYAGDSLLAAIERGVSAYRAPNFWNGLVQRAMAEDFSWDVAAKAYDALYRQAQKKRLS